MKRSMVVLSVVLSFALVLTAQSFAQGSSHDSLLAPTPPMGWNSWDAYARSITEADVKANAEAVAKRLKPFGWQYVVIDEGWYVENPESDPKQYKFTLSEHGQFLPAVDRFPSAKDGQGMKPVADYVHSLGLKFGIHIIRGIPREAVQKNLPIDDGSFHAAEAADTSDVCPWNAYNYGVKDNDAGQAYYDSLAKLYAEWSVDFIKVDCISDHPYKGAEIRMISTALHKAGRPIVLSLSPGPTALNKADEVAKYAEMWRISDDFWDHWDLWPKHEWSQGLLAQFATAAKWSAHPTPGHWPDADMLPIGHLGPHPGEGDVRDTRFTREEQRTLITLWSIFRSPLMMGGNLLSSDAWTFSLLTNPEVIAVDQHSHDNKPVITTDKVVVWTALPETGTGVYVAVFNLSDEDQALEHSFKELGVPGSAAHIRDLWGRRNLGLAKNLKTRLAPHASALFLLSPQK